MVIKKGLVCFNIIYIKLVLLQNSGFIEVNFTVTVYNLRSFLVKKTKTVRQNLITTNYKS